jgi:hypothetical protein
MGRSYEPRNDILIFVYNPEGVNHKLELTYKMQNGESNIEVIGDASSQIVGCHSQKMETIQK